MKSDETRIEIENLKETLRKQQAEEQITDVANKTAFIVRTMYEAFMDSGFSRPDAYELTKIWCVKNFGK